MKTISAALEAHLAQETQSLAICWLVKRTDGVIFAATDHDRDIDFDVEAALIARGLTPGPGIDGTGTQTYLARSGFTASAMQSTLGMNVDNGEAQGMLSAPAITESDLRAGKWDHAAIAIFKVNWADTTMGALLERVGTLGEVTADRGQFTAEWRGLMQSYQATLGRAVAPLCDAVLGDGRCTKDLTAFTVTGTLDAVGADNMTMYDAARAEAGPTGGIAIIGITNANPGVVTLASAGACANGDVVVIEGVVGMTPVNTITIIRNLSGSTFELGIDTSDTGSYPPYVSGGTVTPLGADSGYFDGGLMTFTSGANSGLSMEVRNYAVGQWTLQLPMPYPAEAGDTYTMVAGCDHSFFTCRDRFDNAVNFRGFPYLPGLDAIIQVGHHG